MGADTVYSDCTRSVVMWDMALCLVLCGRSDKGLFLCTDREAPGGNLFGKGFVDFLSELFLEGLCIKASGENRSPAHDIATGRQFFGVCCLHLSFDAVADGFSFGLGFFDKGFKGLQGFDFGDKFIARYYDSPFLF